MKWKWMQDELRKFKIARRFRKTLKEFKGSKEEIKICLKCYHTYLIECMIKGKEYLNVTLPVECGKNTLERYLNQNGFKIIEEHLNTYYIARV